MPSPQLAYNLEQSAIRSDVFSVSANFNNKLNTRLSRDCTSALTLNSVVLHQLLYNTKASGQKGHRGQIALLHPNFKLSEIYRKIFWSKNFKPEMGNLGVKLPFRKKIRSKINTFSILSVKKLQLAVLPTF